MLFVQSADAPNGGYMEFPSLEYVQTLQSALNNKRDFAAASQWSDVKVLLCFGDQQYWLKLYGGKVIDAMAYAPMANPLGWDYMISAGLSIWSQLQRGERALGHLLDSGDIRVDGNLLQANRLYESTHVMVGVIRDLNADRVDRKSVG